MEKVTQEEVMEAQRIWGSGVVKIGSLEDDRPACEAFTSQFLDEVYAFDLGNVNFKPTKCSDVQFRPTKPQAASYFIAGPQTMYPEDKGFAITPWTKVKFENNNILLETNRAIATGNYWFTDVNGNEAKVEYTFGYKLTADGKLKIDLHHSSFPYSPAPAAASADAAMKELEMA